MQRILIAVDFSSCAESVVRQGVELARQLDGVVSLLNVVQPQNVSGDTPMPVDAPAKELTVEEYLQRAAKHRLSKYAALVQELRMSPRLVVRYGEDPAEAIVAEAREWQASMIVVGTKGRHGLARAIYGSVAEEVVRHADVPVTTIRSRWSEGCKARSCNWCANELSPEEERVDAEQSG